ncbi:predicted protein [Pyrenophora tritici-repentis Pt-1C-BFP]|uniref:Uncharacterized protein n=1 Tax=Pyrenophora tritici-repentis (strain Pt-1C-BFP) TaxID=426418 RepID=B2WKT9_PYRTR|nr:uncharacterized protein PTRG_10599 [Pyrenophora tritici-repentis Pt-1C-BFP]EDU43649.1 predicted protein [Pyrenophora tritici-repentis Pt-1C-BFP]
MPLRNNSSSRHKRILDPSNKLKPPFKLMRNTLNKPCRQTGIPTWLPNPRRT